jgi:hypothetical protein
VDNHTGSGDTLPQAAFGTAPQAAFDTAPQAGRGTVSQFGRGTPPQVHSTQRQGSPQQQHGRGGGTSSSPVLPRKRGGQGFLHPSLPPKMPFKSRSRGGSNGSHPPSKGKAFVAPPKDGSVKMPGGMVRIVRRALICSKS